MSVDVDLLKRVTEDGGDPDSADGEAVQNVLQLLHVAETAGIVIEEDPWLADIYHGIRKAYYSDADWGDE